MGSKLNRVIYSCERIKGELMVKAIYKEEERLPDFLSEEVKRTGNYAMYLQNLLQSIIEGRSKVITILFTLILSYTKLRIG